MKLAWILWLASAFNNAASDRACLAATVYLEARGEPVTGQLAVAEVGLRRRDGGQWGNSLCKVLRARGQFALSTTSKNYVFDDADAWQQAWLVAGFALDLWKLPADWRPSIVPNADHFYAADGDGHAAGLGQGPAAGGDWGSPLLPRRLKKPAALESFESSRSYRGFQRRGMNSRRWPLMITRSPGRKPGLSYWVTRAQRPSSSSTENRHA